MVCYNPWASDDGFTLWKLWMSPVKDQPLGNKTAKTAQFWIHPWKLTWNPTTEVSTMEVWKMLFLFNWVIFKFHANFQVSCRQNSIAAKWNIFLSFGLKVPFGFPCLAHVCLSKSSGFVCFSTAYVTLVVALLFGSLVLLPAFLQGFIQSISVPPLQHLTLRTWWPILPF